MIGLKRHTVAIVNSRKKWPALAEQFCWSISKNCSDHIVELQHVGSTAVPGLPAKPIIDIAIGVTSLRKIPDLSRLLASESWRYRGDFGASGGHLYIKEASRDVVVCQAHAVVHNGDQWINYVRFRDALISNDELRSQYAELKYSLKRSYSNDRPKYTQGKSEFIRSVLSTLEV